MSYVHLTESERVEIETYLELSFSMRKITRRLGHQPSTISRELRRNSNYDTLLYVSISAMWNEKRSVVYKRGLHLKK